MKKMCIVAWVMSGLTILVVIASCNKRVYLPDVSDLIRVSMTLNEVSAASLERLSQKVEKLRDERDEALQLAREAVVVAAEANRQAEHILEWQIEELSRRPPLQVATAESLARSLDRRMEAQAGLEDFARAKVALSNFKDVSACNVVPEGITTVVHFKEFGGDLRKAYAEACRKAFKAYEAHRLALR
jgi:hypothetical protein